MTKSIRTAVVPAMLLVAVGWYGCAPHSGPVEPESDELADDAPREREVAVAPDDRPPPERPMPDEDDPSSDETRARRGEPPAGAPTVATTSRFDALGRDTPMPERVRSNEIDWFLGNSSPNPSWSPDGQRLAHFDGDCVSIRDSSGKLVKQLRTKIENAECHAPRWSPNGRKIITSHTFHGPGILFDVGSKRSQRVGARDQGLWSLQFADDRTLVGRVHQSGAVLVNVAASTSSPLVTDAMSTMTGFFPSVSPDARRFARVLGDWQGPADLEIASVDLRDKARVSVADPWGEQTKHSAIRGKRELTVNGPILEYAWSRDGRQIAAIRAAHWYPGYGGFDYGFGDLILVNVETGAFRVAVEGAKNPTWSPDGRFIAFDSSLGGITLFDAQSRDGATWELHGEGIEPLWSPSGDAILTLDPEHRQGVVLHLKTK